MLLLGWAGSAWLGMQGTSGLSMCAVRSPVYDYSTMTLQGSLPQGALGTALQHSTSGVHVNPG